MRKEKKVKFNSDNAVRFRGIINFRTINYYINCLFNGYAINIIINS